VLLGAVCMPFALLAARMPSIFLGFLLSSWAAVLVYASCLIVCLYLGVGLLRLKPLARTLTIYYSIFAIVNMAFFYSASWIRRTNDRSDAREHLLPFAPADGRSRITHLRNDHGYDGRTDLLPSDPKACIRPPAVHTESLP
jgi:hypothetical protein